MTELVLVYGTLRKGYGNHRVMDSAGGELLRAVRVAGYKMYHLGGFPGVIPGDEEDTIYAELYSVDDLDPLDWLEGYNEDAPESGLYNREKVILSNGESAWIYTYNGSTTYLEHIVNGDWAEVIDEL